MKRKLPILLIVMVLAIFAVNSCGKSDSEPSVSTEDKTLNERIALLETTAKKIESALAANDHAAFLGYFSPQYVGFFKEAVQNNSQKLSQFNEIFTGRKLLACDGNLAVFELSYNGKTFEMTMELDESGAWKLKDM